MFVGKKIKENHIHQNGNLYYCCSFYDEWLAFPFLIQQLTNMPEKRIQKFHPDSKLPGIHCIVE